jgi:hypothetical protein
VSVDEFTIKVRTEDDDDAVISRLGDDGEEEPETEWAVYSRDCPYHDEECKVWDVMDSGGNYKTSPLHSKEAAIGMAVTGLLGRILQDLGRAD